MSRKTNKRIFLFVRYLTRIGGIGGFLLYLRLHILKWQSGITTKFIKFPFSLRKGTSDLATFDQVFLSRIYDLPLKFVPRTIIDCGANVGMASVFFANRYPEATIVAIEPEDSNFEMLTLNCKPYKNIQVLKKAVWHHSGKMKIVDAGIGHYGFAVKEVDPKDADSTKGSITESITLDEVMQTYAMDRIDLLKIDIEGAEKDIFSQEYDRWLSKTRSLTVEVHDRFVPGASKAIIKAVAKYDFSVYGSAEGFFCELDA